MLFIWYFGERYCKLCNDFDYMKNNILLIYLKIIVVFNLLTSIFNYIFSTRKLECMARLEFMFSDMWQWINPEPANGGSECQGNNIEIESCSIKLCPGKC